MKNKSAILIAILIMSIGFAAISTTLIINGSTSVGENTEDFDVIFTKASLDGTDAYQDVISQDKKTITFETSDLKTLNQTSVLTYEVTNNSSNYDAEVEVNCKVKDNTIATYTSIENVLENNATIIKAKETLNGTLTVTLNKVSTENIKEKYTCEIVANAKERDTLGYNGPTKWAFDYTGGEQIFNVPVSGTYKLEIWGAQGGYGSSTGPAGGYGGYSEGIIYMLKNENIYVNIGGQGETSSSVILNTKGLGGYNGGGYGTSSGAKFGSGGGGATHIALSSGLLSTFENNQDDLLIVSGGGGAGFAHNVSNLNTIGGSGGGYKGGGSNGGNQENSGTNFDEAGENSGFGIGGSSYEGSGGGGGFYGGGLCVDLISCGGGSGYIGNSLLTEKTMYCYNCEESTEENTKTISTTCANETPTENCAKSGNGYARITLIR